MHTPLQRTRIFRAPLVIALLWILAPVAAAAQANDPTGGGAGAPTGDPAAQPSPAPEDDPTPLADSLAGAAFRGDAEAQYRYAQLFERGEEGLVQDYGEAADWYGRAAEQGHVPSMLSISTLFFSSNPSEAMRWVIRAAELGSAEAQWRAGQVLSGRIFLPGVSQSRGEAIRWLQEAVAQGHHPSEEALADVYTGMEDTTSLYDDAVELYRRAAEEGGSAWAALRLGMIYAAGEGVEADDSAAFEWFVQLGSTYDLDPGRFSDEDLEVLGGLQSYYGLDFMGGDGEMDLDTAVEAFNRALASPDPLIHPSFRRTARAVRQKIENP